MRESARQRGGITNAVRAAAALVVLVPVVVVVVYGYYVYATCANGNTQGTTLRLAEQQDKGKKERGEKQEQH